MKKTILGSIRMVLVAAIFSLGIGVAFAAFSTPTGAPSASTNVLAPINLGTTLQTKTGPLWADGFGVTNNLIVQNGKVGIGMATIPVEKLEVVGNAKISANVYAGAFLYSSDINLKKNIKPLGSELDKILALQPVSFDWKADSKPDVGFIAQEVEKIFPEVVHTNATTNLKSIDYPKLTVFLVQALQEQQKEIEQLKLNR